MSEQPNTTEAVVAAPVAQDGLNVVTLVLGISGASLAVAGAVYWMALTVGGLALISGLLGRSRARAVGLRSRTSSWAGIGLGAGAIVLGLAQLLWGALAPDDAATSSPGGEPPPMILGSDSTVDGLGTGGHT
ncbi:MAG TPA: hypothetical protein VI076_11935 [Actinopolymorphaceae bacterium]